MGQWTIVIEGAGFARNEPPNNKNDADQMFKDFVQELKDRGHHIVHASITLSARLEPDDIKP